MSQHLRPASTVDAGTWTYAVTSLHADTDEGIDNADDDDTYAQTDIAADDLELALSTGIDPTSALAHVLQWRARRAGVYFLSADLSIALYEGAVLIATSTSSHGDDYTSHTYTLSAAEANAITDYTNLRVRIRLVSHVGGAHLRVTAAELTIPGVEIHAAQRGAFQAPEVLGEIVSARAKGTAVGYC